MTKYKEEYVHSDHLLYVQLGENVRKLRKRCHLTQDELAACIGIDQKRVSKIERGEARPNLTLCLKMANAFQVSVDALLDGVVEYEMVQTLLNDTSEQLLAQELLQVVKRYIREAEIITTGRAGGLHRPPWGLLPAEPIGSSNLLSTA